MIRLRYGETDISDAVTDAAMSSLIPGAGQWTQGRRWLAIFHFGEVVAFGTLAAVDPSHRGLWITFAIASGLWTVVDALWHRLASEPARRDAHV